MNHMFRLVGRLLLMLLAVLPATIQAVLAQPPDETVAGKALFPGQPIRIYMTGAGKFDLVYYAAEPGTISVYARSLDDSDAAVDTTLDVLAPDGASLASNDDLNLNSGDAGIEDLPIAAGAYRIRLGTFSAGETGGVEVELVMAGESPELMGEITGQLTGSQPFAHTFRGQAGQTITISALATNPPSPNLDLALAVYAPDGTQLGFDDDSGPQVGSGDRDAALIDLQLPADGEYRVEVSSYLNISGEFQLRIDTGE